jgi:hypothetical protein
MKCWAQRGARGWGAVGRHRAYDERRPPVGEERKCQALGRHEPHDDGRIEESGNCKQGHHAEAHVEVEAIGCATCCAGPCHPKRRKTAKHEEDTDEAELLRDEGQHEVRVHLRQVLELLPSVAEPLAEEAALSEGDVGLY